MTPETKLILERKRQQMAEKGIELTPNQFLDSLHHINHLCLSHGHSILEIKEHVKKLDATPPKPPYKFLFESQEEAQEFANKAKEIHNVECEINLIEFRRWELISR